MRWGIDLGEIYVITGPIFDRYPHEHFTVYQDQALSSAEIYPEGLTLYEGSKRMEENYNRSTSGDILRPSRKPNASRVPEAYRDLVLPTGYFKVIYAPSSPDQAASAIGFLLPHSFEDLKKQ